VTRWTALLAVLHASILVGQGQANIIPVILGIGILLVIPEIMQQVKKAMGVEEGVFGQLAGAALKQTKEAVSFGWKNRRSRNRCCTWSS
jgi:hypothetical protein